MKNVVKCEKNTKNKRRIILGISLLILTIVAALCGYLFVLNKYPQMILTKEALYGEEGKNLKDFTLNSDKTITSTSDDPWILFTFENAINVKCVDAEINDINVVNGGHGAVYIVRDDGSDGSEWAFQTCVCSSGDKRIIFESNQNFKRATGAVPIKNKETKQSRSCIQPEFCDGSN